MWTFKENQIKFSFPFLEKKIRICVLYKCSHLTQTIPWLYNQNTLLTFRIQYDGLVILVTNITIMFVSIIELSWLSFNLFQKFLIFIFFNERKARIARIWTLWLKCRDLEFYNTASKVKGITFTCETNTAMPDILYFHRQLNWVCGIFLNIFQGYKSLLYSYLFVRLSYFCFLE